MTRENVHNISTSSSNFPFSDHSPQTNLLNSVETKNFDTPLASLLTGHSKNTILSTTRPVNSKTQFMNSTASNNRTSSQGILLKPALNEHFDSPFNDVKSISHCPSNTSIIKSFSSPKSGSSCVERRLKSAAERKLEMEKIRLQEQKEKEQERAIKMEKAILQKQKVILFSVNG